MQEPFPTIRRYAISCLYIAEGTNTKLFEKWGTVEGGDYWVIVAPLDMAISGAVEGGEGISPLSRREPLRTLSFFSACSDILVSSLTKDCPHQALEHID